MKLVAPRSSRLGLILPLLLVAGCSTSLLDQSRSEFDDARRLWQAQGATDYDFDLQHLCYCSDLVTRPVTIGVRGGAVAWIVYTDSGTAADTTLFRDYLTIDRVFALLQRTLDGHPASFTASYQPDLGYPAMVHVDPKQPVADDEFSVRITGLRPPPP